MPGSITLLPRFTTLVGVSSFSTIPIDVTGYSSIQLQVWRGALWGTNPTFKVYLEESMDAEAWTQGPIAAAGYDPGAWQAKFFSYFFQLRWFRLRADLGVGVAGVDPMVTCWAEGFLR